MTRFPLALALVLSLAVAGCGGAAGGIDHSDPEAVARAYAIADHEHDHETVYQLLHLSRREGADQSEWVDTQQHRVARSNARYRTDNGHAREAEPREVEEVETSPSSSPMDPPTSGRAIDVVVHFADGQSATFAYGLVETEDGWRVESTEGR